ncbi:MAG: hypothetical protein ABR976_06370 [Terracidiphilus sp.]|jgi:hypothetical protein
MSLHFKRIVYKYPNSRQQETYNFQKASAVLAEFGYLTIRLSDDWNGADFIAQHFETKAFLKVQLKGRLTFSKKYRGQELFICFRDLDDRWYLYPHDEVLAEVLGRGLLAGTDAWDKKGGYDFPYLKPSFKKMMEPYRLEI